MMRRELNVLDFDGVTLLGAVVRVDRRGAVEILRHAASTAATLEAALGEVTERLGRMPRACVVRSVEVVAGLVRLPVASGAPDEIAEMLRWEIEPLFAQQSAARPVAAILEARRHLDRAQKGRVLAAMEERRAMGDRDVSFGAVARDLGYVTDAQLGEALAIEERLESADGEPVCGWAAQRGAAGPDGVPWLAVGVPASRRRFWAEQLAARGLALRGLYPRLPGAAAALGPRASATLVEVEPYAVARTVLREGSIVALEIVPATSAEPAEDVCRELVAGADPTATFVCGSLAGEAGAGGPLFEPPLRGPAECLPAAWAGVAAAARHAAGRGGPGAAVPARDPGRPLLRRPAVRWAAAVALVVAAALGADRLFSRALSRSVSELAEARGRLDRISKGIRDAERKGAEADALENQIAALERERDELRARSRTLEEAVALRARLLPGLLDALAGSVDDEIRLDRTVEESPGRIRVEGRALSERSVQAFARSVAARVVSLSLHVLDQSIRKGSQRGSPDHYSFSFLLEPRAPEDA